MSRSLASTLAAAAVAALAALGLGGMPSTSVPVEPVAATEATPERSPDATPVAAPTEAPTATDLLPGTATEGLEPRLVVPARDLHVATAPLVTEPDEQAAPSPRRIAGTGTLRAASGTSADAVDRGGRTIRFSVEVEEATGLDPDAVAAVAEEALYDSRSWARDHDLQRVAPSDARIHVVVATPASVDRLCAKAGLDTNGWLSCWNGSVAAINLDRWTSGVPHVEDLAQYRRYVVNHEVGHALGRGHLDCTGGLAPLMAQQTKSLDGCTANEWAYP